MSQIDVFAAILSREGAEALGWERGRPGGPVARLLLRRAARRVAREFADCDQVFATRELPDAARWTLDHFSASVEVSGVGRVPRSGPLLLVANHPGLTDAVALLAALDRADVRIVAADYPFLHAMHGLGPHLIFLGASQLGWIRAVARDLRRGGAVLLFPAGRLEPDASVLGRAEALLPWSESVGLIRRLVPDAVILPAAVSGVLSPRAFAHPLTRVRRGMRDRRRVATLLQMIDARYRRVTARVAFGPPLDASVENGDAAAALALRVRELLVDPPMEWMPLARRPSEPAATTAA